MNSHARKYETTGGKVKFRLAVARPSNALRLSKNPFFTAG